MHPSRPASAGTAFSRRSLLASAGAAGTLALLSACAGQGTSGRVVNIWNAFSNNDQMKYYRTHFAEGFPGKADIVMTVKPLNNIDRLTQTALAAGSGPDLVGTPGPSTGVTEYVKAGYLLDLDRYVSKYGWEKKFAPWALGASRIDGKLRTLPTSYESMLWYYNPETLDKLDAKAPTDLDSFVDLNTEAKGKGLIPIAAGNADWKGANEWHVAVALNHIAGPEAVYSALQGKTKWTDAVFVDAVSLLASWFAKGWYGGDVQTYFTTKFPTVYTQLANGKAASMISGSWEFSNLSPYFGKAANNSATWDWSTIAALGSDVPKDVYALGIGASEGVNAHSKHVADAVAYLDWSLTNTKLTVAAVADASFQPAPIRLTADDFGAKADSRLVRFYADLSSAKNIGYTPWTFFPQKTETYVIDYWENVITDKLSPKEYCAGIQSRFEPEFAAGKVPTAPAPDAGIGS